MNGQENLEQASQVIITYDSLYPILGIRLDDICYDGRKNCIAVGNLGMGKKKLDIAEDFIKGFFAGRNEIASNDILGEAAK